MTLEPDWGAVAILIAVVAAVAYRWVRLGSRFDEAEAVRSAIAGAAVPSALAVLISPFDKRLLDQALDRPEYFLPMALISLIVIVRDLRR